MRKFEVRWRNFRSFEDTGWLAIRPLTLLIGPNNSGKTSLIAPLLVLKQTLDSHDRGLPLKTSGELLNIGSFEDFIFRHDSSKLLTFEFRWADILPKKNRKSTENYTPPPASLTLEFSQARKTKKIDLRRYLIKDVFNKACLSRYLTTSGRYSLNFPHKLPRDTPLNRVITKRIRSDQPQRFLFEAFPSVLFDILSHKVMRDLDSVEFEDNTLGYLAIVQTVNIRVINFLNSISYIGPLRKHPKRFYEMSGEKPMSVGPQGELAPEIIHRGRRDKKFIKTIEKWLRVFDFDANIASTEMEPGTFSVDLRSIGKRGLSVNFADTGFGLSQVLPLIVQGSLDPTDGLVIAEQPEIHLNPKLQGKLADLFVNMANSGKGVIVETHSEHLLLRLRRLIAEKQINAEDVAIYFIEKEDDISTAKMIPIKDNGHIDPNLWPKGFFEDSLHEAFQLATIQSRSKYK